MPTDSNSGIYYEVEGSGPPLILGFPFFATMAEIMPEPVAGAKDALVARLSDGYRVLTLDHPCIGRSADRPPEDLTAERVAEDLLSVANHAGFERFAYAGYSWGGNAGLQLALRTDRLTALVIGGWPPLGAEYALLQQAALEQVDDPPPEVQVVLRSPAQYAQWVAYGESMAGFSEAELLDHLQALGCPCLAYVGAEGDVGAGAQKLSNATIMRRERDNLEARGWEVTFIADKGHEVGLEVEVVAPIIRDFLDRRVASA